MVPISRSMNDAANDVFVNLDTEGTGELLGDSYTAEPGIALFDLDDG
jgi:hypothetical protein